MSEHMRIAGRIQYDHLPMGDASGMSWCASCKKPMRSAEVSLHDGFASRSIHMRCATCKRVAWVSKINIQLEKLNKKCAVCKKATSWNNAVCVSYSLQKHVKLKPQERVKPKYLCSNKCYAAQERMKKRS